MKQPLQGPPAFAVSSTPRMKRRLEIEIKLSVPDRRQLRRRLKEMDFRETAPRVFEKNSLFDFEDRRLARAQQALRLRTAGGRNILTFKETPSLAGGYKSRDEFETGLADGRELRKVLERLGLREVLCYSKYRTTYSPPPERRRAGTKAPVLVFDETSKGDFIELEGPRRWIDRVAKQLGYDRKHYITRSYVAMLGAAIRDPDKRSKRP